jgi:hypothetical protein
MTIPPECEAQILRYFPVRAGSGAARSQGAMPMTLDDSLSAARRVVNRKGRGRSGYDRDHSDDQSPDTKAGMQMGSSCLPE